MVSQHIADHMADEGIQRQELKRLWLHQANKSMNDFIGKKAAFKWEIPAHREFAFGITKDFFDRIACGIDCGGSNPACPAAPVSS